MGGIRNVRSFLGLDTGMVGNLPYLLISAISTISTISTDMWQVGCVRRLEINDRFYSLETAAAGGDIMAGRDIGEGPGEITRDN